ncbi:hypothetical protein O181_058026 [Austropuccinia psidii MF-1]|uniref:Uncharacterized protein n=1 Tax=Austropuccinia psidii MF-1 TaxID=1389203 RepID=A0A9Q3E9F5_9BASI|nr:hypothetical protein [Austropuccinia psidii MF-1]
MVTFSGQNHVIPNQSPNPSPILKEDSSATQSGNSLAATRRPFEDPNHLALQEHQVLSIPWTTQLVHTGSNQASCMAMAYLGQFKLIVKNAVETGECNFPSRNKTHTPQGIVEGEDSPVSVKNIIKARKFILNGKDQRQ